MRIPLPGIDALNFANSASNRRQSKGCWSRTLVNSTEAGFKSRAITFLPSAAASNAVTPPPTNGSNTTSPGLLNRSIKRRTTWGGFRDQDLVHPVSLSEAGP